jgi:hypothetical protein
MCREVERGVERLSLSAKGSEIERVEVIKYKWGQAMLDPI